jgi:hypothetical protein
MRWATLPSTGRSPLDYSTALDRWPTGAPAAGAAFHGPEVTYAYEQSRLYPTKRALMLVCRVWSNWAVEFMWESLVINRYGVGRLNEIVATLQASTNGLQLAPWVRRIDAWITSESERDVYGTLHQLNLPNLRMQIFFDRGSIPRVSPRPPLSQRLDFLICGDHSFQSTMASRPELFQHLRALTLALHAPVSETLPPSSNLRRLIVFVHHKSDQEAANYLATLEPALPSLTHLTLHIFSKSEPLRPWISYISIYGVHLLHLVVTNRALVTRITIADIRLLLAACLQLVELAVPPPEDKWSEGMFAQQHTNLQLLGVFIFRPQFHMWSNDYSTLINIFSQKALFPNLLAVRIINTNKQFSYSGLSTDPETRRWMHPHALRLLRAEIRLEDYTGRDMRRALVETQFDPDGLVTSETGLPPP